MSQKTASGFIGSVSVTDGSSSPNVGGVAGDNYGTTQNCYNVGSVTGTDGEKVGGVAGTNTGTVKNSYNIGEVNGTAYVGGIVGINRTDPDEFDDIPPEMIEDMIEYGTVQNCYYLSDKADGAVEGSDEEYAESRKDEDDFNSGYVAWLLQDGQGALVWGQQLGIGSKDEYPILTSDTAKKVYKVEFIVNGETELIKGVNSGGTVRLPDCDTDDYTVLEWRSGSVNGTEFTDETPITADTELYAVLQEKYASEQETIVISLDPGYEETRHDLDQYIRFAGGDNGEGYFTYAITENEKHLDAEIDGSYLVIHEGAEEGGYELTVEATVQPKLVTLSLGSYGTDDPVILHITVAVGKIPNNDIPTWESVEIEKTQSSITVIKPDNEEYEFYCIDDEGKEVTADGNRFTDLKAGEEYTIFVRYKETETQLASKGAELVRVTTVNEDGSTTLKPGETVKGTKKGEDVENRDGKVTVKDSSGNETTVTLPEGKRDVEIDENGNVIIPGGSVVAPKNGTGFTVSNEAAVEADGSATLQGGKDIEIGKTAVTVPEGGTVTPNDDGTVTVPDGSAVTPPSGNPKIEIADADNKARVDKDGNVTLPEGGDIRIGYITVTVPRSGGTTKPNIDGTVTVSDGSVVQTPGAPDITVGDNDNRTTVDGDGNVTVPANGSVEVGGTTVTLPDGGTVEPNTEDGIVIIPEGAFAETSDGETVYLPDGGTVDSNGKVTPNGADGEGSGEGEGGEDDNDNSFRIGNTTIIPPEGETVTENEDGTVTVPDGSVVKTPSAPDITVGDNDNKTIVDKDGNVTVPENGSVEVGGTTITVPDGGTIKPNTENNTVTVPAGSTAKTSDGKITELPDGGTVDSKGNVTPNGGSSEDNNDNDNADSADKNPMTGVILVTVPFIAAAAGVIVSGKRKQ